LLKMAKTATTMDLGLREQLNSKTANAKERVDSLDAMLPHQARELLLKQHQMFRSPVQGKSLRPGQQAAPKAW
jgi:hypothetical protein